MSKGTDLRASGAQSLTDEQKSKAGVALARVAGRLAVDGPSGLVYSFDFAALLGAMVYEVGFESGTGGGEMIQRAATVAVGDIPDGVTRVDFALHVALVARALGYDWSGDNRHLIPGLTEAVGR
ncbi:hypothetical protein DI272_19035 [Streptomyces sp. Act143]|uniref:hypothetical protein n=1 Tax=Streptomyces sp. Act143 TaxID=2200760 RepID=UPI000D677B54|nr:hypothetical protein [Streptomyces sp. Act143]PWI16029.1 hypothetical protein DI272_19035 [Streptomyces sp. Act143]